MKAKNFLRRVFTVVVLVAVSLATIPSIWAEDFTIVVLPDTQFYSKSYPAIFSSQTQWIVDNKDTLNIAYVAHVGDIVDSYNQTSQWNNAQAAMSLLEDPTTTGLYDGIPYGLVPGNHDEPTGNYNYYFGVPHFQGRGYYGGGYPPGSNDNNFTLFSAGGMDFIVINLEYLTPATGVLEWADSLLKTYASRRAIVVSHYLLNLDATWSPWGQQIYDALKDNPNLFLMLAGHIHGESRRVDVHNGITVNTLLSDYQSLANGGNGWLRLLTFSPTSDEINVKTYSPYLKQYDTDTNSQFLLFYNMGGTNAISFQDGVWPNPDYSGTRDTVLLQNAPSANFGSDLALYVDGDDPSGSGKDLSTLLYWDISAIPLGSAVKGASITLNVLNQSSHSYQVYEMKRDWVESESTWNSYASGHGWEAPGALGAQDRGNAVLGSLSPSSTGLYAINLNSEGVALIQSWVDNPAGNRGFIIANSGSSDGADFDSREVSTVSNRPTMTVRYSSDQPGNQPPVAAFTSNCSGLNCNLDATGTEDPDGTIVNYTWDFGDGKTGTGPTISHSYDAGGIYSVVLTVTDDGGATDMQSQGVEVISRRMFVSSISMSGSRVFTGRSAKAVITILDTKGNPVSGASVSGAWGGNYTKNVSGTTSTSGTVSFTSARVYKANATFTFTVKGVVKSTYVYDPGINKETVDTIVVP
jgi:PKD repeat protein